MILNYWTSSNKIVELTFSINNGTRVIIGEKALKTEPMVSNFPDMLQQIGFNLTLYIHRFVRLAKVHRPVVTFL